MNRLLPFLIFTAFVIPAGNVLFAQETEDDESGFITIWKTDNRGTSNNDQITIPGEGTNYLIKWEDVNNPEINGSETVTDEHTITFPSPGRITISGDFTRIYFGRNWSMWWGSNRDQEKILDVEQWGTIKWTSMGGAFRDAFNLIVSATDAPDLTQVTDMFYMFAGAKSFNSDLNHWEVSQVTNMNSIFYGASVFNGDVSSWDVSNVTDMFRMFAYAKPFNSDMSSWDVSNVTNMKSMFSGAVSFNSDLSDWDVSNVTDMTMMFSGADAFTGDVSNWDVSRVIYMWGMFFSAELFNGDLNNWDVGNVKEMDLMFSRTGTFNGDLNKWDVSSVTSMHAMFRYTHQFNGDISSWNVSNVIEMDGMFNAASSFNGDLSNWNVGNVERMDAMFYNAISFNSDLSSWDVSNVSKMGGMFYNAISFNSDLSSWVVSNVLFMERMFEDAVSFNGDLGQWDVSNVTRMAKMLNNTAISVENYDRILAGWSEQTLQSEVELGVSGLGYCESEQARRIIINTFQWNIIGDSHYEACVTSTIHEDELPVTLKLYQNYPNPFNPNTQIRYAVPQSGQVHLAVYNIIGQKVATLVDETSAAGWYEVSFDASGFSSGLFIYRIESEGFVESRQMLLVK